MQSQSTSKFDKPWWATSEDEEQSGLSDLAKKTWLKKKEEESKVGGESLEVNLRFCVEKT